jgi:hypothetical protein
LLRLPLRQTEGFVRLLMTMMRASLAGPDHTTLARRWRTGDVRDHRWRRKGPVDIVMDSTGLVPTRQSFLLLPSVRPALNRNCPSILPVSCNRQSA